ncbi:MAG: GT4 family glycosyltransferase PelF [Candidatus Pacearchaeota archaeon]
MNKKLNVVLTTEGTYPYYTGGVSTWADILIKKLDDIDFRILAIMMHPYITIKYDLPSNVKELINVPLWGTEEPTEYISGLRLSEIFLRKLKTHYDVIEFVADIIKNIALSIYFRKENFDEIGFNLVQLYDIFQKYDYRVVFRSKVLWNTFYDISLYYFKDKKEKPSAYEIVESLRWLYRFFISILSPIRDADIYHSTASAFCGLPCIIAKLKKGVKFVLTEHGIYMREQYLYASRQKLTTCTKDFFLGLISLISKLNYYFADIILPVCEHNKRWEKQFVRDMKKIKVIYNGIDTERFRKIIVERENRPTAVMVARIDHLKDIETYIKICSIVKNTFPNILFKLYGPVVEQDYYESCKKLVNELNLENNFSFSGVSLSPEIANNEGDVIVLTSISEAFPFAVLEGMACEKVVISSDVGGTKEILEGYGFIVKPRDVQAFAEKIIYTLQNPSKAAEIGIEARQRVVNGFRIDDMIKNYRDTYYQILKLEP